MIRKSLVASAPTALTATIALTLSGCATKRRPDGLVHPIGSYNPLKIALHEWSAMAADVKRARSWRERLRQLFGRPADSLANMLLLVEETPA